MKLWLSGLIFLRFFLIYLYNLFPPRGRLNTWREHLILKEVMEIQMGLLMPTTTRSFGPESSLDQWSLQRWTKTIMSVPATRFFDHGVQLAWKSATSAFGRNRCQYEWVPNKMHFVRLGSDQNAIDISAPATLGRLQRWGSLAFKDLHPCAGMPQCGAGTSPWRARIRLPQ